MSTTDVKEPTEPPRLPHGVETHDGSFRARLPLLAIIGLTLIGCAAVIYNSFASVTDEPLDKVAHAIADKACTDAYTELKSFPALTTADSSDRADLLERENKVFENMAATLGTAKPTDSVGADAYGQWVADWRAVNRSRAKYAQDLRASPDLPELLLPEEDGGPITNRMNKYSRTHDLIVCASHNLQAETVDGVRNYPNDPTKVP